MLRVAAEVEDADKDVTTVVLIERSTAAEAAAAAVLFLALDRECVA